MGGSLDRVRAALRAGGVVTEPLEMAASTRTADEAAAAAGCALDQIVKSILFEGPGGALFLFLTAGGNRVDPGLAAALAGVPLGRAGAERVRQVTGFAIGGVAPVGHLAPLPVWMDPRLMEFDVVWAAAGTPRHVFAIAPDRLRALSGATVARFAGR
jgi:prolyl-tRNA editing enzyme YbaK/EbsC (Cys-tRNA(Pro) deacylase)